MVATKTKLDAGMLLDFARLALHLQSTYHSWLVGLEPRGHERGRLADAGVKLLPVLRNLVEAAGGQLVVGDNLYTSEAEAVVVERRTGRNREVNRYDRRQYTGLQPSFIGIAEDLQALIAALKSSEGK